MSADPSCHCMHSPCLMLESICNTPTHVAAVMRTVTLRALRCSCAHCPCAALQLTSYLPSATPLPELQAIATGSFAGSALPHVCSSQMSAMPI